MFKKTMLLLTAIALWMSALAPQAAAEPGRVLKIFAVGGVLTEDGTLWQYSPSRKWQTIDEAFRDQGRETRILPLPVEPARIDEMVTFGFLKTDKGDCWLYDLDANEWRQLTPPSGR